MTPDKPALLLPTIYAIALHVLLIGLLSLSFSLQQKSRAAVPPPALAIQAQVVDESLIAAELEKLEDAEQRRAAAAKERQEKLQQEAAQARAEREKEQQQLAEIERQRVIAQRNAEAEAEQIRIAREQAEREIQQQQQSEKQRLAELEQARIAEEKRLAALEAEREKENARKAEEQRKAEAAERKRREEARKKAELEEQLRLAMAEESARQDAENAGLLDEYIALIAQRIVRNWIQPPGAGRGLKCELIVTQIPGGEVTGVEVVSCNGDAAVVRSVEAAVFKASPLPPPGDPRLFERRLRLIFEPDN